MSVPSPPAGPRPDPSPDSDPAQAPGGAAGGAPGGAAHAPGAAAGGAGDDDEPGSGRRRPFLLRLPPDLMAELREWSGQELRSLNGHLEFLLRQAVRQRRRAGKKKDSPS